tara:strand:+ start:270 stop:848 length:579 start_codon:yes stop_codon:yes gene_type:complete
MSIKAIFGLGNPGDRYVNTRHNIGFKFINALKSSACEVLAKKVKLNSQIFSCRVNDNSILLVKPQTYMNLSGEAVQAVMNFYKLSLDEICIIADDIDIEFSNIRVRKKGGAGTHNGLKSIIKLIGSNDFLRIRLGIGSPPVNMQLSDYVLQDFSENEQQVLDKVLVKASHILLENLEQPQDIVLNKLNSLIV